MMASTLTEAGYRTGLYTSPHLIEPTERIQVNGIPVSEEDFAEALTEVHGAAEKLLSEGRIDAHPSYFETVTAMALLLFGRRCDISVVEVGLGGRLDATNIIQPELTVITPVSFDHEAFLGNTLDAIASEKAGILKRNVPLVLAKQGTDAERVIRETARELNVPVSSTADLVLSSVEVTSRGSRFVIDGEEFECLLPGRHQIENAKTAILALEKLGIGAKGIRRGLSKARWPGRLELVSRSPDFVLDGAHNPAGAAALADYIREFCQGRPVWMVYGAMRDKAIEEVTTQLFPVADRLILTAPSFPRTLRPEAIAESTEHPNRLIAQNVTQAIEVARSAPRDAIVLFTGSLYLVGEVRAALLSQVHIAS
jgi:dihydrofolate synthase/folylpolyglutamate synthase